MTKTERKKFVTSLKQINRALTTLDALDERYGSDYDEDNESDPRYVLRLHTRNAGAALDSLLGYFNEINELEQA